MMLATIIGTVVIVLVTVMIGRAIDRKVDLLPDPEKLAASGKPALPAAPALASGYLPGEAPASAIRATGAGLDKLRTNQECPDCRTIMSAEPDDRVRYAGRELLVVRTRCARCGTTRSLYVDAS